MPGTCSGNVWMTTVITLQLARASRMSLREIVLLSGSSISQKEETSWNIRKSCRQMASHLLKAHSRPPNHQTEDNDKLQTGWLLAFLICEASRQILCLTAGRLLDHVIVHEVHSHLFIYTEIILLKKWMFAPSHGTCGKIHWNLLWRCNSIEENQGKGWIMLHVSQFLIFENNIQLLNFGLLLTCSTDFLRVECNSSPTVYFCSLCPEHSRFLIPSCGLGPSVTAGTYSVICNTVPKLDKI